MSEGAVGLGILVGITVVVSSICHFLITRYVIASMLAALVSIVLFLWVATIRLGHVDSFIAIAFVVGGIYSFGMALVVGIPFLIRRRKPPLGHCQKCGYDLTGNESGTCPECGTKIVLPE